MRKAQGAHRVACEQGSEEIPILLDESPGAKHRAGSPACPPGLPVLIHQPGLAAHRLPGAAGCSATQSPHRPDPKKEACHGEIVAFVRCDRALAGVADRTVGRSGRGLAALRRRGRIGSGDGVHRLPSALPRRLPARPSRRVPVRRAGAADPAGGRRAGGCRRSDPGSGAVAPPRVRSETWVSRRCPTWKCLEIVRGLRTGKTGHPPERRFENANSPVGYGSSRLGGSPRSTVGVLRIPSCVEYLAVAHRTP